jgi:hypothetical protein
LPDGRTLRDPKGGLKNPASHLAARWKKRAQSHPWDGEGPFASTGGQQGATAAWRRYPGYHARPRCRAWPAINHGSTVIANRGAVALHRHVAEGHVVEQALAKRRNRLVHRPTPCARAAICSARQDARPYANATGGGVEPVDTSQGSSCTKPLRSGAAGRVVYLASFSKIAP